MPRCLALLISLVVVGSSQLSFAQDELPAKQIREAVQSGVEYLKREQQAGGKWPDMTADLSDVHVGGVTSLVTLALLDAGLTTDDKAVKAALKYLETVEPKGTYSTSLQIMVFAQADAKRYRTLILRNVKLLEETQIREGKFKGAWGYSDKRRRSISADNSNTQFAVSALYEAERSGVRVSDEVWKMCLDYWLSAQSPADGSWSYLKMVNGERIAGTGSMTAAGIAALSYAPKRLEVRDDAKKSIDRATGWLEAHFSVAKNPVGDGRFNLSFQHKYHFYYLWMLSKTAKATGKKTIGKHDWYREGTDVLLKQQDKLKGSWSSGGHGENRRHIATSLAILFLCSSDEIAKNPGKPKP